MVDGNTWPAVRVVIVDDDEDVRMLVRAIVDEANEGLTVVGEAANAPDALAVMRATSPTVLVLDNWMPGMSGLDLVAALPTDGSAPCVVLFSAYVDQGVRERAAGLDICEVLEKDDFAELPNALRRCAARAA